MMTWGIATFPPWVENDEKRVSEGFVFGVRDYDTAQRFEPTCDYRITYEPHEPAYHTYWFLSGDEADAFRKRMQL